MQERGWPSGSKDHLGPGCGVCGRPRARRTASLAAWQGTIHEADSRGGSGTCSDREEGGPVDLDGGTDKACPCGHRAVGLHVGR